MRGESGNSAGNRNFNDYGNPAEILSLKGKGKIREGYDADLCVLDQGLEIQEVVARGKTVYRK